MRVGTVDRADLIGKTHNKEVSGGDRYGRQSGDDDWVKEKDGPGGESTEGMMEDGGREEDGGGGVRRPDDRCQT